MLGVVLREGGARLAPKSCLFYVGPDLEEQSVRGLLGEPALKVHSSWNPQRPPFTLQEKDRDSEHKTQKVYMYATCGQGIQRNLRGPCFGDGE